MASFYFNKHDLSTFGETIKSHEEMQKIIDNLDENEQTTWLAYVETEGDDFDEAYRMIKNGNAFLTESKTLMEEVDNLLYDYVSADWIKYYIDYEKLADDLESDGYIATSWGVLYVG